MYKGKIVIWQEKGPWEMEIQERIEAAGRKKEEGIILYKSCKYQRAIKKYNKAVEYVSEEGQFGNYDEKVVKSLRVSCWLNVTACSLKLDDQKNVIILCSKALESFHKTLKQLEAESNKRDAKLYRNMFAQMANDCSIQTKSRSKSKSNTNIE
ncbi:unnamed protein product [Lactuca saligna]|uniref:Peptidylprolyl isomerase n=1 Tax=Lactuca saligna TaxID=75948 RepID=A0AA36E4P0_LACSI|nr:unnamed protein product [Lactuca saligna]